MKVSLIGLLIFVLLAVVFGSIAFPSLDELTLLLSSSMFLLIAWMYKKDRDALKEEE